MGIMQPVDCSKYDHNTSVLSCIISYRKFTSNVCVFWLYAIFEYISNLQCGITLSRSIVVVQSLGHVRLFATPLTAAYQASLSITDSWSLLKLMSIELVTPSNYLILCHPLLLLPSIFPSIRVFSSESVLHIRWLKYWSFSFSIRTSNKYSGLISFRIDFLYNGLV